MRRFAKIVAAFMLLGVFVVPVPASAVAFLPFGGRIVSQPIPCIVPPGIAITIAPFGTSLAFNLIYLFAPPTLSVAIPPIPSIPPTHIGQQVLGTYAPAVMGCKTAIPGLVFFGFPMLTENNSTPSGGL